MAKKRDDRIKEKKLKEDRECNLDGDYLSPFRSFRDFTFENIKAVIGHSRYAQILIFLSCAGFFLRFYNLGFNSLWLDEAATLNFAKLSFIDIWNL
ncbi:MAG: glycosyl transferase, partial [Methanoregula sp.]|nr:glycosyl transferase [Methanoregula sp.]